MPGGGKELRVTDPGVDLPRVDVTVPNEARMMDFFVGGKDNFAADRDAARQALAVAPDLPIMAQEGRNFLGRAVRFLAQAGIGQFIDIGCGLPTRGNTHEIAQNAAPGSHVVYVDNDPVVIAHAQALLANDSVTGVVQGDMYDADQILTDPILTRLIDLSRPVAILLMGTLAIVPDDDAAFGIVKHLRDSIAPGSYLALSHAISDIRPEMTAKLAALYQDSNVVTGPRRNNLRTTDEIAPYFDGLELVEPGLVRLPEWRPEPRLGPVDPASIWAVGGVGLKHR
jgi:S-adenosyl methyltransferase